MSSAERLVPSAETSVTRATERGTPSVEEEGQMLFMVIERFKNRDAKAVYRRFRDKGRMAPEGLTYVGSWIEANWDRCFQLMECQDARLLQQWVTQWQDLCEFEFIPVVPSKDTVDVVTPLL